MCIVCGCREGVCIEWVGVTVCIETNHLVCIIRIQSLSSVTLTTFELQLVDATLHVYVNQGVFLFIKSLVIVIK